MARGLKPRAYRRDANRKWVKMPGIGGKQGKAEFCTANIRNKYQKSKLIFRKTLVFSCKLLKNKGEKS